MSRRVEVTPWALWSQRYAVSARFRMTVGTMNTLDSLMKVFRVATTFDTYRVIFFPSRSKELRRGPAASLQ